MDVHFRPRQLIEGLLSQRQEPTDQFLAQAAGLGIQLDVEEQFWLVNGFLTELQLSQVESLLNLSQLS